MHRTIKGVTEDLERFRFNTAISKLQVLTNEMRTALDAGAGALAAATALAPMLAPFAPFAAEELWREVLGNGSSVHVSSWPAYDPSLAAEDTVTLIVQVDGKVRDKIEVPADANDERCAGPGARVRVGASGDRRSRDREGDRPRPEARELRHGTLTSPRRPSRLCEPRHGAGRRSTLASGTCRSGNGSTRSRGASSPGWWSSWSRRCSARASGTCARCRDRSTSPRPPRAATPVVSPISGPTGSAAPSP